MRIRVRELITAAAVAVGATLTAQSPAHDIVITNARIVDGTGASWYRGEIAITGDTIVDVAAKVAGAAARTIDAGGQVVSPGFIDTHTHARRGIFEVPTAENYVRQGVTTLIEGPDGSSPVPLGPFLDNLAALQKSVNIGSLVGQGSIRSAVIGEADRKATT
ncbi:MAG: D-aminoacylase, partial [Vicinamibacterales bacterium]